MVLNKQRLKFSNRRSLDLSRRKRKRIAEKKINQFEFERNILQREIVNLNSKINKLKLIR